MQRFIFITILFLSAYTVNAQITGPTSVTLGQSASYLVYEDIVYSPFNFTVVGGTVTASSRSGTNYNVTITWNFVGAGSLKFNQDGQTLAVTVTGTCAYMNPVTPTATFSVSTPVCGPSRTISYTGTPPAGYTWFWQTTSTGTATTNSTTSYTVSTSGTYYLRARSTCIDSWGPAVATPVVAVNPVPSIPPSVTNITACILSTFTLAGTVGANGNTLNWYTAATGGTPIAQGASVSYSDVDGDFAGSTTFYASSFNTTSGCESTSRKALTVTFKAITPAPTSLTGSSICVNGTGSATLTGVAGNGNTLRWYGASWYTTPGTPLLGSGASFSTPPLSATTTYYARAYNATTTCESYVMPVTATVQVMPNVSATNQSIFSGQTTSIAVTNPNNVSGTVFNWTVAQTGISGGLSGSGATITQALTTTAQANGTATYTITPTANGCSGTPSSVTATVYPTPIITAPQNFVVKGVPVTLDAGAGYDSYTWKNSALATLGTARTFNAVLPDTYSVLVTKQGASVSVTYLLKSKLSGVNQNYVVSNVALVDNITDPSGMDNLPVDQVSQLVVYSDGLGRPSQHVTTQGSPLKNDIIQPIAYDEFGREVKQYLSYASSTGDGTYRTNAVYDQSVFYNPTTNGLYNGKVKTDADPYATIVFDSSPLNRPLQVGAPGTAWQPNVATPDNGKAIKSICLANIDGSTSAGQEKIKVWTLSPVTLNGKTEYLISPTANYASNTLLIKIIKDAENKQSREYYDKQGKLILKKVQYVDTNTSTGAPRTFVDDDWILTYYLYDDLERLRFILQPKFIARNAVYAGLSTQQLQKNMLDSLAFEYRYDEKGRVIYKHDPGAQPMELVYDQWNRVILSQDGNQRNAATKKWSFVKYDAFNRPIIQGEYASTNTRDNMVTAVNAVVNRYENITSGNGVGYTLNLTFPTTVTINDVNNIIYYDDYSFKNNLGIGTAYDVQAMTGFTISALSEVKTKVTGAKFRILGGTSWLVTAAYYDDHYRSLQVITDDHLGNKNITTKEYYGLTNWITKKQVNHGAVLTSLTEVKYDHGGRVTGVWQTMDKNPATKVLLASNNYNELGQLYEKNVHSSDNGTSFLQSNDYRYNIRGWLTSINNSSLTNDNISNDDANDLFGMELKYENTIVLNGTNTMAKYDGNVSAMQWKTSNLVSATDEKAYGFKYDNLNRLTGTNYATKVGSSWTGNIDLYNENITYDKNGNIRSLKRSSLYNSTNNVVVDDMAYYYKGNQLDAISDNASSSYKPYGFSEAMQGVTTGEYTYDYNGSITVDQNKGLVGSSQSDPNGILYNSLGLPIEIRKGTSKVTYMYNAAGVKLRKIIYLNGTEVSRTDYVGGIVYENNQLQLVSTLEGRVVKNNGNWEYEYFHKDHLGNTRVVYGYKKQVDTYRATMETVKATGEENQFKNVATTRVLLYNHTLASQDIVAPVSSAETNGNIILSGSTPKAIGPAKMLQVSSGDRLQLEVYARYNTNVGSNTAVITTLASAVTGAYGLVNSGETASAFQALTNNVPTVASGITRTSTVAKAYLFYILFDNNYVYKQFGYQAITSAAAIGHERLYLDVTMPTDGYLYTYVANESNVSTASSVYFDDFTIIHNRTNSALQVVQTNDYYPYGLQSTSWTRDNSINNNFLYDKGTELNSISGIYETFFRGYDPAMARFMQVDPLSFSDLSISPFAYAGNNPIAFNDPSGLLKESLAEFIQKALQGNGGTWSSADEEPHYFSEAESVALGNALEDGASSGSFITDNGDGTGSGMTWNSGEGEFFITVTRNGIIDNSGALYNGVSSTFAISIPTGVGGFDHGDLKVLTAFSLALDAGAAITKGNVAVQGVMTGKSVFKLGKLAKVLGKVSVVANMVDMYQHSMEGVDRFNKGDYSGAAVSAGKFLIDGFFIVAKANPVINVLATGWAIYNAYDDFSDLMK